MAVQIALLRAVNVGGRSLAMAGLKAMFDELGFPGARTLLQTGNVVFESGKRSGAALESFLEARTAQRFDLKAGYVVRSAVEWVRIVADNPFPREAERDPARLVVMPLKAAPAKPDLAALQAAIVGREIVHSKGQTLYIVYPDGIGQSKLTVSLIERKLATRGTCRNWNTTLKLLAMVEGKRA